MLSAIRVVIAALVAVALAALPVAAGFARPAAVKAEMAMSAAGDDCPCCDASHARTAAPCMAKCCSAGAILVEKPWLPAPRTMLYADMVVAEPVPFALPPDPPPPRS